MSWLRRLFNTLRPGALDRDIERELSFHLAERTDHLRAQGLNPDEATRHARLQFGNPVVHREGTKAVDVAVWVDATARNVRHAIRSLARTPGFTVTVVVTLALGIGANTAVFSAIDGVLLKPLPFPEADRLVLLAQTRDGSGETRIAPTRVSDWNRSNTTFDGIAGYFTDDVVDTSAVPAQRFHRAMVSQGFFRILGMVPARGRDFIEAEHRLAGPTPVIISDRRWRALGTDPNVLGRSMRAGLNSIETIGIMPPAFRFPEDVDVWSADDADAPWAQSRALTWFTGIGRLKPGVTVSQAQADLDRVQAELAQRYPDSDRGVQPLVTPLKDTIVGDSRASLWLLFGSVSILLLIACTNIAALLLSRAARRSDEIAIRHWLGGSRAAVAAQLLTEAAVLAFGGATCGLAVAIGATTAFRSLAADLPRVSEIVIDGRILAYTVGSTVVVAVVCGLIPALRGARACNTASRSARTDVSSRQSVQWALVGLQIALSVTLLAGAGLLLRSIDALSRVDTGLDPTHVLTLHVSGQYGLETTDEAVQRINRILDDVSALPGVESIAVASLLPGVRDAQQIEFTLAEGPASTGSALTAESRVVSPHYFETLRIPLIAGGLCRRPADAGGGTGINTEVMVNRRFADVYRRGREVIGLHLAGGLDALVRNRHLASAPPSRIVGIVGDARELGADRPPTPTVYTCFSAPNPAPWHLVRTTADPLAMAEAIRRKIYELEPRRSVYDVALLEARMGGAYAQNRLRTWLLALFAMTALALVCAGVYGTLSYAVSLRRREVALRLALGAVRRTVVRQLMATTIRVVAVATACGLALALLLTRSLSAMLYGVTPADPPTLAGVLALVIGVALLAAVIPAARATLVQPMRALREE
jgi:putative ABC transport system permease protein